MLDYLNPFSAADIIGAFLDAGGPVVTAVGVTAFAMCALIGERLAYFHFTQAGQAARARERWAGQADHGSWAAHRIRERLISEFRLSAEQYLGVIRVLVLVVPLLGLLGTVTGMIFVFDGITSTGSSNARVLAEGISRATIPTMTGLAVALVGVFFINLLERNVSRSVGAFADSLDIHLQAGSHGGVRGRRLTGGGPDEAEVNITPLLDIVFILLIFFIVTATFVRETGLSLHTPEDDPPEETVPPPSMLLSVREDGFVMVNNIRLIDPRSVKPVVEEFRARSPNGVVLVSVAPRARAEATVTVLDQSRQAGVEPAVTEQRRQ